MGGQLPLEADAVEEFVVFFLFQFSIPCSRDDPSSIGLGFYLPTLYALKLGVGIFFGVEIRTQGMNPSGALFTHDPLLAVVGFIEVNLLTINAKGVLLELVLASRAKGF